MSSARYIQLSGMLTGVGLMRQDVRCTVSHVSGRRYHQGLLLIA